MRDQQLSFLAIESSQFDVNAVDDGVISPAPHLPVYGSVALALAQRAVDDWVFCLGFTSWKAVIDHAILTGHHEIYNSEDGVLGLRKHGYRYAPIPRLPAGGATYTQQRLLSITSEQNIASGRNERMVAATPEFSHKCVIEGGICNLTVKQGSAVFRAATSVDQLSFSDRAKSDAVHLSVQLNAVLVQAGTAKGIQLNQGCLSLATHILRIVHGVR
jgi:hypothetical protein